MSKDTFQAFTGCCCLDFFFPEATCKYVKQNWIGAELDPMLSAFENLTYNLNED